MRAHVPAVGGQRDGAGECADDQLADHHHGGDHDHPFGATFASTVVLGLVFVMGVCRQIVRLHGSLGA